MIITSAKITGNPDKASWSQVYDTKPEDEDKASKRGRLTAVVATHEPVREQVDKFVLGREIFGELYRQYYESELESNLEALKLAAQSVTKGFDKYYKNIEIAVAASIENIIYLAASGGAMIFLLREGVLVKILESCQKDTVSASGYVQGDDIYILGTKLFFDRVGLGVIKGLLSSKDIEASAESLAPLAHEGTNYGSYAAAFIKHETTPSISKLAAKEIKGHSTRPKTGLFKIGFYFKEKFVKVLDKLILLVPQRKIVVREELGEVGVRKKRVSINVGIILLVILAVSIFFGVKSRNEKERNKRYSEKLSQAQHEFSEAKSLTALNPSRARELIFSARSSIEELEKDNYSSQELRELSEQIKQNLGKITGTYETKGELFLDMSLISSGFKGDKITLSSERVLVLDQEGERLVEILIGNKKTQVLAGPDLIPNALDVSAYANRSFVLTKVGVFEIRGDKSKLVLEKDWSEDILIAAYTGNFYILEKSNSLIKRYPSLLSGNFGGGSGWFGPEVKPNLTKVLAWAIDGSIWVLSEGGKIEKFIFGRTDSFFVSNITKSLEEVRDIFTDEGAEDLYLLDPKNSRVIVLEKDGQFKAEYVSEKVAESTRFLVSEKERKIILLAGDKLYSIDLKHLD